MTMALRFARAAPLEAAEGREICGNLSSLSTLGAKSAHVEDHEDDLEFADELKEARLFPKPRPEGVSMDHHAPAKASRVQRRRVISRSLLPIMTVSFSFWVRSGFPSGQSLLRSGRGPPSPVRRAPEKEWQGVPK